MRDVITSALEIVGLLAISAGLATIFGATTGYMSAGVVLVLAGIVEGRR